MEDHELALLLARAYDSPRVSDVRLEQMARLTASRYWRRMADERWSRAATIMFKPGGEYLYVTFPIYRGRYHAAVRVLRDDVADPQAPAPSDLFDVVAVSVLEAEVRRIALAELDERP